MNHNSLLTVLILHKLHSVQGADLYRKCYLKCILMLSLPQYNFVDEHTDKLYMIRS